MDEILMREPVQNLDQLELVVKIVLEPKYDLFVIVEMDNRIVSFDE